MEKIYLSDSGPKVSPAVYGFWRWEEIGSHSYATMEKTVNLCMELGINTLDHTLSWLPVKLYSTIMRQSLLG
jgi:predicted oxidoreductase